MLKSAVLSHFDNSPVAIARALGVTRSAVNQWPSVVPLKSALRLQSLTQGLLSVDMAAYQLPEIFPSRRASRRLASS